MSHEKNCQDLVASYFQGVENVVGTMREYSKEEIMKWEQDKILK